MRLPRKGILIRLFIYVPLIGFFGWKAWEKKVAEDEAAATQVEAPKADPLAGAKHRKIIMPDGSEQVIYEVTPAQAAEMLGAPVEEDTVDELPDVSPSGQSSADAKPSSADAKPSGADAKPSAPDAKPSGADASDPAGH